MTEIIDTTTPETRRSAVEILLDELEVDAVFNKPVGNQLGWDATNEEFLKELKSDPFLLWRMVARR